MLVTEAPMVLCAVSSAWRQIALTEPRLWDTVSFVLLEEDSDDYPPKWLRFIEAGGIQRWFGRAGPSVLLSLGIEIKGGGLRHAKLIRAFHLQEIILNIGPKRFRTLKLDFGAHQEDLPLLYPFDAGAGQFMELSSLTLAWRTPIFTMLASQPDPEDLEVVHTAFSRAPKLTHLKIAFSTARRLEIAELILPWATQLTNLEVDPNLEYLGISTISFQDYALVLGLCRNIQNVIISAPSGDPTALSVIDYPTFGHASLTSLTMFADHTGMHWDILRRPVSFHQLQHLHIRMRVDVNPEGDLYENLHQYRRSLMTLKFSHFTPRAFLPAPPYIANVLKRLRGTPAEFPELHTLAFPHHNLPSLQDDVEHLLQARQPKGEYPGLKVEVIVSVKMSSAEVLEKRLGEDPACAGRFRVRGQFDSDLLTEME